MGAVPVGAVTAGLVPRTAAAEAPETKIAATEERILIEIGLLGLLLNE